MLENAIAPTPILGTILTLLSSNSRRGISCA